MLDKQEKIEHTNYISNNPIIAYLLNNFICKVKGLLKTINAYEKKGLDAGCGEGHLLDYLHGENALGFLSAVDLSEANVRFARKHYPLATYQVADIFRLPFPANTFDYVLSTEVFEHLPNPQRALVELGRVAKPNAHLIISVPFEPFFHWGNLLRGKYWYRSGYTPDHRHFWRRHQFRKFLSQSVKIQVEYSLQTFPWLLYACRFK